MIFPTLIFNRSPSLIDSCFQRTVKFFTLYSPLSVLQTILTLVCLFLVFSMLCFGVSPLLFSVNCCKVFNANGMSSHDENFVLLWHILSISIVKLLNKNATLRHRTKQWKVEPKTDKKVQVTLILLLNKLTYHSFPLKKCRSGFPRNEPWHT